MDDIESPEASSGRTHRFGPVDDGASQAKVHSHDDVEAPARPLAVGVHENVGRGGASPALSPMSGANPGATDKDSLSPVAGPKPGPGGGEPAALSPSKYPTGAIGQTKMLGKAVFSAIRDHRKPLGITQEKVDKMMSLRDPSERREGDSARVFKTLDKLQSTASGKFMLRIAKHIGQQKHPGVGAQAREPEPHAESGAARKPKVSDAVKLGGTAKVMLHFAKKIQARKQRQSTPRTPKPSSGSKAGK